jgi:hypothetical protein
MRKINRKESIFILICYYKNILSRTITYDITSWSSSHVNAKDDNGGHRSNSYKQLRHVD